MLFHDFPMSFLIDRRVGPERNTILRPIVAGYPFNHFQGKSSCWNNLSKKLTVPPLPYIKTTRTLASKRGLSVWLQTFNQFRKKSLSWMSQGWHFDAFWTETCPTIGYILYIYETNRETSNLFSETTWTLRLETRYNAHVITYLKVCSLTSLQLTSDFPPFSPARCPLASMMMYFCLKICWIHPAC